MLFLFIKIRDFHIESGCCKSTIYEQIINTNLTLTNKNNILRSSCKHNWCMRLLVIDIPVIRGFHGNPTAYCIPPSFFSNTPY